MQSSIDKMYCLNPINNINSNSLLLDHKFNLIKSEMYPDPYSHMTVTCLEYPEKKCDDKAVSSTEKQKELSKAQSRAKRFSRRNNIRYMTQPVTLIEIKETEEDGFSAQNSSHSKSNYSKEN